MTTKKKNIFKKKGYTNKGFTLVEVLVSTFIFVIIMSGIIIIFTRQSASFSFLREQHRNIENAQFAMNSISKILRTSSVADVSSDGKTLYVYSYSHEGGKPCFRFDTRGGTISVAQVPANGASVPSCGEDIRYASATELDLTTGFVAGSFVVRKTQREDPATPSINEMEVGLITMSLRVQDDSTPSSRPTVLQTSVSLRDYPGEISF